MTSKDTDFCLWQKIKIKRNRLGLRLFGEFKKSAKKISSINKIDKTLLNHYSMVNTSYLFLMINAYPPVTFRPVHYDVTKIAVFRRTSLLIPCFSRYLFCINTCLAKWLCNDLHKLNTLNMWLKTNTHIVLRSNLYIY